MGKTKVKTFLISFLFAAVAACLSVALVACSGGGDKDKSAGKYGAGEEGIYYYDKDASTEYLMTLQSGVFMVSTEGTGCYAGTYSYDEEAKSVSFKTDGGDTFDAAFSEDAMQLAIDGTPYTFLKRVNYTVTFVDGNSKSTQSVVYGRNATAPETDESRIFIGWYEDAAYATQYRFDKAVTGDLTLYAYYIDVDSTIANYDVTFIMDGETVYETKTQNGVIYDVPEVEGVLGWWISDTGDADALTRKYDGETLTESEKLFAVKDGSLGASVYDDKVTWMGSSSSVTITVDGTPVTSTATNGSYAYPFSSLSTGSHTVAVSASGYRDETLVYVANKLDRVSNFSVYGNVLVYNAVENAQYYCVSVTCGNASHDHTAVYNGNTLSYDFSACEMGPDGISFTVYAYAQGYETSVSETYVYALILDGTTVKIDSAADTASWNAVTNATGYEIYINGGYAATTTDTEYSFKYYEKETEIEVAVKPVAPGYYSETSAAAKYTKATLAAPKIISVSEYEISWTPIVGVISYELNINGILIETATATYLLSDSDKENISDVNMNAISVTAIGSTVSENSQQSDIYYMTDRVMSSVLSYADGVITWQYALAADSYVVSVDGTSETVTGVNTYDITFTHSGETEISVYFMLDGDRSAMARMSVTTYAVIFDSRGGRSIDTIYVAKGDKVYLETLADTDYELGMAEFKGWYTLPDLTADENASVYAGDGVEFVSGTQFDYNGTLVLYAFWINQQIAVTLYAGSTGEFEDENGQSLGSVMTSYISYGSRTFTLPVPVNPDGNTFFIGWYTAENGGIQFTDANGVATALYNNTNITELYAHWGEALSLDVTTYNGQKVLSVSAGKDISSMPNGVLYVAEEYEVNGTVYPVGVALASAFAGCTKLTEINLPDTILYISTVNGGYTSGSGAFSGCTNLRAVNIYATGVGEGDTTKEIMYYSADGVLFEKDPSTDELTLIYYPHAKADATYTVPSVVKNDAEYVLEGTTAVLSEGHPVTALATRVLSADGTTTTNRFQMTEVIIPASVKTVANQCFYYSTNIVKITFLEAATGVSASLTIDDYAFERCTGLTDVTLPSHLSSFNMTMFDHCSSLTGINVTAGGTYSSTDGTGGTTKGIVCTDNGATIVYCSRYYTGAVTIAGAVTKIGEDAFEDCTKITSVEIGGSVTLIEESAFEGCTGMESIIFKGDANSGDMTIKTRAFYGLTNSEFTEITLPVNLTKLEKYAFGGCTKLVTVRFESYEGAVLDFATDAFASTAGSTYIVNLYLGKYVPAIEFAGVFGKKLAYVEIDEDNAYYTTDEQGVVYDKDVQTVIYYPLEREGEYIIPDTVQTLGDNVFNGRTGMTYVYIPASVTVIGYQAFYGCSGLEEIEFELTGGTELAIADSAFYNCTKLTTITLPYWITSMGEYDQTTGKLISMDVFSGCSNLESIIIDETDENKCDCFMTIDGVLFSVRNGVADELLLSPRHNKGASGEFVIPETVTRVWDNAFYYNDGITKISFENDLAIYGVEFGGYFSYRSTIEEIVLPVGTTAIPEYFCYYSTALRTIYVPYTVETIDYYAFYYCTKLEEVIWGDVPVTSGEGDDMHGETGTETVAPDLKFISSRSYTYTYIFGSCSSLTEMIFPDRTTTLTPEMFYSCSKLAKVYIGPNITEIPERTFYGCTALVDVEFAKDCTLETIGSYAFTNTGALSLEMPESLIEIQDNAFGSMSQEYGATISASAITYVKFNKGLETIGEKAFYSCKSLAVIEFEEPNEIDYSLGLAIGSNAFYNSAVEEVTLPYYLTSVSGFYYNLKLTAVNFADTPEEYVFGTEDGHEGHTIVLDDRAFRNCTALTSITIPWYISSIGEYALAENKNMTSVTFDESKHASILTDIKTYGFYSSNVFTEIRVPASIETIGDIAFSTCTKLSTFEFGLDENGCSSVKSIGKNAFLKTSLTSFTFPKIDTHVNPNGIELGEGIFKQCTDLTKITLSNGVTSIGSAFNYCYSIAEVDVGEESNFKSAANGSPMLYSADGHSIVFTYGEIAGDLVIDEGVAEIAENIFMYQNTMTSVTIPATVVTIGDNAFFGCTSLKSVYFAAETDTSKTSALQSIGEYAFAYCSSLEDITLPSSLESIGPYTFQYCTSLKEITIPEGIELCDPDNSTATSKNYSYDFRGCTSLEKVVFMGVPSNIGSYAFSGCTSLRTLGMGGECTDGVIDLSKMSGTLFFGKNAFSESGAETVILPAADYGNPYGGTTKMVQTFYGCASLTSVTFAATGDTTLCSGMFYECSALKEAVLNENMTLFVGTSISTGVFSNCTSLERVITGGATIPSYTFYGCTSLNTIADSEETLVEGVVDISDNTSFTDNSNKLYTFYNCSSISFVVLPNGCTIGNFMFYGCTALKTVTTASKYESGDYTEGVADLENVSGIYTFAFASSGVENLIFPAITGTTASSTYIFGGCQDLESVTFCEGAITLNCGAFSNCPSLETVTLRSDITLTAGTTAVDSAGTDANKAKNGVFTYSGLKTVLFDGMVSLPNYTFYGCVDLTTVAPVTDANYTTDLRGEKVLNESTINYGIVDLTGLSSGGTYEFYGCVSITTVVYPSTLSPSSNYMFTGCSSLATLTSLEAGDDGTYDFTEIEYGVVDLSSFTALGTYLFQDCVSITTVILPDTLTVMPAGVFYGCVNLTTVGTSDTELVEGLANLVNLTQYGTYVFSKTGIKEAILGANTINATSNTAQFYGCENLEKVTLTKSLNICRGMFSDCPNLLEVISDGDVVATIGAGTAADGSAAKNGAFCDCVSLKTFEVEMASITAYTFYNCRSLTDISLISYTTTGNYAFYGCASLESVDMPDATGLGTYAFYGCTSLETVSLPSATSLPTYAFYGCTSLAAVAIPSVTSLGTYAFYGCTSLGEIAISSVTSISNYAFYGCTSLGDINLSAVRSIGDYSFYGCLSLKEIDLSSATSVGTCSFYGAGLETLNIPEALDTIGAAAFGNCLSLSSITVDEGNNVYEEKDGIIIDYVNSSVVFAAGAIKDIVIPEGVTSIGDYAFYEFEGNTLTMSDDVTYIGKYAFSYAYFGEITLSQRLDTMDKYSFYLTKIESISIPASVTVIGEYAFAGIGTTSGSTYNLVVEVTEYSSIKSVTFEEYDDADEEGEGEKELSIGMYAFAASSLESIELPDRLTELGTYAFLGTTYMTSITFGTGLTKLPNYVCVGAGIVELDIPEWITELGNYGFVRCESMETLTFHEGLETIGTYEFVGASSLVGVTIPGTVTSIGTYSFSYSDSLEWAVYEEGCTTLGTSNMFKCCPNFTTITLPESLEKITASNFEKANVKSIIVPRNVESIADKAFDGWDESCYIFLGYLSPYESIRCSGHATKAGSDTDFETWLDNCEGAHIYYYSETQPAGDSAFEYWHYDTDGVTPVAWNV